MGVGRGRAGHFHDLEPEDMEEYLSDLKHEVERMELRLTRTRGKSPESKVGDAEVTSDTVP
ncbi:MAG: hypothetical protein HKL79_06480 [Thermoplasmata archaeon]|jgi:NAD kinase|nr:hypothetical protein [Thermoplasmata archaeon]